MVVVLFLSILLLWLIDNQKLGYDSNDEDRNSKHYRSSNYKSYGRTKPCNKTTK